MTLKVKLSSTKTSSI